MISQYSFFFIHTFYSLDLVDPYIERIRALNLQEFIEESSEFGLDIKTQLVLVNQLREEIIAAVMQISCLIFVFKIKLKRSERFFFDIRLSFSLDYGETRRNFRCNW